MKRLVTNLADDYK